MLKDAKEKSSLKWQVMKREVGQFPSTDVAPAVSPALAEFGLFLHFNLKSRVARRGYSSELLLSVGVGRSSLMLFPEERCRQCLRERAGYPRAAHSKPPAGDPQSPLCSAAKIKFMDNLLPACLLNKLHIQMKTEKL